MNLLTILVFMSQVFMSFYIETVPDKYTYCRWPVANGCPMRVQTAWDCLADSWKCPSGTQYHCTRVEDNPSEFIDGCAESKLCFSGEAPYLSYVKNGLPTNSLHVTCSKCHDTEFYNSAEETNSSTYSQCKLKVRCDLQRGAECDPKDEKTLEIYKHNRLCSCDARNNYIFAHPGDLNGEKCTSGVNSYLRCERAVPCPNGEELLLNYSCGPKCVNGHRTEDSDECVLPTTTPPSSSVDTNISVPTNKHVKTTKPPTTSTTVEGTPKSITSIPTSTENSSSDGKAVSIVLGVLGVLGVLAIVVAVVIYIRRREKKQMVPQEGEPFLPKDHHGLNDKQLRVMCIAVLDKCRVRLKEDLGEQSNDILDRFHGSGIFPSWKITDIRALKLESEKKMMIIDHVKTQGVKAYRKFKDILHKINPQLYKCLDHEEKKISVDIKKNPEKYFPPVNSDSDDIGKEELDKDGDDTQAAQPVTSNLDDFKGLTDLEQQSTHGKNDALGGDTAPTGDTAPVLPSPKQSKASSSFGKDNLVEGKDDALGVGNTSGRAIGTGNMVEGSEPSTDRENLISTSKRADVLPDDTTDVIDDDNSVHEPRGAFICAPTDSGDISED